MLNDTPLQEPGRRTAHGCYAGLPIEGERYRTCSMCDYCVPAKPKGGCSITKAQVCLKFRVLTGKAGKPIDTGRAICRYFEPRAAVKGSLP